MEGLAVNPAQVRAPGWSRAALALGLWAVVIVGAAIWGADLREGGARIALGAAPLFGMWDLNAGPGIAAAVAVGAVVVVAAPGLARRLRWRRLLAAAVLLAALWPLALAVTHGIAGINEPLEGPSDYLVSVPAVHAPGDFLSTFTERIDDFSTHVRSHPPGMVLILSGLDRAGLGGSWPAAVLILSLAATAAAAALIALRSVAGEAAARRAAPFVVVAPGAVWIATTADALFMAVGAWAVALLVLALTSRGRRSTIFSVAGGFVFGLACFLSFGLVLLALIPAAVAIQVRRIRPLAPAVLAAGAVALAFLAAGYWWLDGYAAAREQYLASIAKTRPYEFFLLSNLAAFGLAAGPAAAVALARLRDRRVWILVGGALAAVALADLSGMSKGEVERIWLPFLPWVLLACAALPGGLRAQRSLLGAQVCCALAIEAGVATIW